MHGSSTRSRCRESLSNLADAYDSMIQRAQRRDSLD
jgi:hypothetical protein